MMPSNFLLKAGANEETLLQKQNCVQDAKKLKNIFCFQDTDFVSSAYVT